MMTRRSSRRVAGALADPKHTRQVPKKAVSAAPFRPDATEQRAPKRSKPEVVVKPRAPWVPEHSGGSWAAAAPALITSREHDHHVIAQLQQRHLELFGVDTSLEDVDALRALLTEASTAECRPTACPQQPVGSIKRGRGRPRKRSLEHQAPPAKTLTTPPRSPATLRATSAAAAPALSAHEEVATAGEPDAYTSADDDQETYCEVCGDHRRSKRLLLCDGCPRAFHTFCLTPVVDAVPEGDWFCPVCLPSNADQHMALAAPMSPELLLEARRKSSMGRMRASFYLGRRSLQPGAPTASDRRNSVGPSPPSKRTLKTDTRTDGDAGCARVWGGDGSGRETSDCGVGRSGKASIAEESVGADVGSRARTATAGVTGRGVDSERGRDSVLQWNPADRQAVDVVNKALHPSTAPHAVLCRETQCTQVCNFVFGQLEADVGGSLYVAGPPGTGKSLAMARLTAQLHDTTTTVVNFNCMSVKDPKDIYSRLLQTLMGGEKPADVAATAAARSGQHTGVPPEVAALQSLLCGVGSSKLVKQPPKAKSHVKAKSEMVVLILDEMDALITREQEVLYHLFELPELKDSRCILIGVANNIDLTVRLLPRLQARGWEPHMVTFPAYSAQELATLLEQRMSGLPWGGGAAQVAAPAALQLCARRMAAASGDMRRCLGAVRGALEILAAEAAAAAANLDHDHASDAGKTAAAGDSASGGPVASDKGTGAARCSGGGGASKLMATRVTVSHMAAALGQLLKSPVVDAIKGLPQHAQLVLCAALRLQSCATKNATMAELEAAYLALCKKTCIRPEPGFSSRCSTLSDLALLGVSGNRGPKSTGKSERNRRVRLRVALDDVTFALQGSRFFRHLLVDELTHE